MVHTVFVPDAINTAALEVEAADLERQIANLTAAVKAGGNIPALVEELKSTNTRLAAVRRGLEPREQHDREQLRLALDQRVAEWKQTLRANPAQGRQVLHHVIGPIMLWLGEHADLAVADAADPRDRRGKEGLTAADVRWTADTKPSGLLAGMGLVQQVASLTVPTWNQIAGFIDSMRRLRDSAGFAAWPLGMRRRLTLTEG